MAAHRQKATLLADRDKGYPCCSKIFVPASVSKYSRRPCLINPSSRNFWMCLSGTRIVLSSFLSIARSDKTSSRVRIGSLIAPHSNRRDPSLGATGFVRAAYQFKIDRSQRFAARGVLKHHMEVGKAAPPLSVVKSKARIAQFLNHVSVARCIHAARVYN